MDVHTHQGEGLHMAMPKINFGGGRGGGGGGRCEGGGGECVCGKKSDSATHF
jgi:hypothetical protein